jgi:hypothetical protein
MGMKSSDHIAGREEMGNVCRMLGGKRKELIDWETDNVGRNFKYIR